MSKAPTFGDYRAQLNENLLRIRQDDESEVEEELDQAVCGTDFLEAKVEKLKLVIQWMNIKLEDRQDLELRKLMSVQPYNANSWFKVLRSRPEFIQELTAKQLMTFVDFCIVELSLSKTLAFGILGCVRVDLVEQPEVYRSAVLNWVALCEQYELPVVATLSKIPDILHVDPACWNDRIEDLKEFFQGSKYVGTMIRNNPEVLTMWYSHLKATIKFMIKVMHVDCKDISAARVMDCDLLELKNRFFFLDRCGLYKHPSAKALGSSKSAEPPIKDIVQASTEEFVTNVAGNSLAIEEYGSFKKTLLEEELFQDENTEVERLSADEGFYEDSFREDLEEKVQHDENFSNSKSKKKHRKG